MGMRDGGMGGCCSTHAHGRSMSSRRAVHVSNGGTLSICPPYCLVTELSDHPAATDEVSACALYLTHLGGGGSVASEVDRAAQQTAAAAAVARLSSTINRCRVPTVHRSVYPSARLSARSFARMTAH